MSETIPPTISMLRATLFEGSLEQWNFILRAFFLAVPSWREKENFISHVLPLPSAVIYVRGAQKKVDPRAQANSLMQRYWVSRWHTHGGLSKANLFTMSSVRRKKGSRRNLCKMEKLLHVEPTLVYIKNVFLKTHEMEDSI